MGGGGGGGSTPQPPSARPASTGPSAHGMFGGGAAAQIGEREREYAAQQGAYNGNGRDQSVPVGGGDHPNKRSRIDEDERRKRAFPSNLSRFFNDLVFLTLFRFASLLIASVSQRHSSALPSYTQVGPNRPSSTGPPPNSAPAPPPLHHPSPLPPPNALPPLSTSAPSPAPTPQAPVPPPSSKEDQKPLNSSIASNGGGGQQQVEVTNFDPETAPKDLKKEGSDWMTMFNPNVKRVLDVGLVHTLVHDSFVCFFRFSICYSSQC